VPHVFVETNWVFAYAAPAHHQIPTAVQLLERARSGEFVLHVPNLCLAEARDAIRARCQPRTEANALRKFLSWATRDGTVTADDAHAVGTVLSKFENSLERDLERLDDQLRAISVLPFVDVFALDETMLARATELILSGIALRPFDQSILAGILVTAERLWNSRERELSFCEADADLQPWDKRGQVKPELRDVYDRAHLWVYGDFSLTEPARRLGF